MEKATFGAGCFWGIQATFDKLKGVVRTTVGYSGGHTETPTYKEVCTDMTGHVEVVEVEFDPSKVSYEELLDLFWEMHDPTQLNRQGVDIGSQYRSVIFYHNKKQKDLAEKSIDRIQKLTDRKIVTEILPVKIFYMAEEYHQKYLEKNRFAKC